MDAIVVFDADGVISLFNASAERMFCTKEERAVGSNVTSFFPEPVRRETLDRICRASMGHENDEPVCETDDTAHEPVLSFTGRRETGDEFPIEATASCLDVRGKKTYTLIVRDVSERKRAEQALTEQAESLAQAMADLKGLNDELGERQAELERAMAARSRFYASMSHELRTPINAVLGYSTLLLENIYGPLNEKQAEGITRTHKAAKHLLELVNDVLDLLHTTGTQAILNAGDTLLDVGRREPEVDPEAVDEEIEVRALRAVDHALQRIALFVIEIDVEVSGVVDVPAELVVDDLVLPEGVCRQCEQGNYGDEDKTLHKTSADFLIAGTRN